MKFYLTTPNQGAKGADCLVAAESILLLTCSKEATDSRLSARPHSALIAYILAELQ